MKITIVHRQDGTGCLLRMDDDIRIKLEALGFRALQMIQEQDPMLWSHAANTGFLKIMRQGACILRCIGVHGIIPLTDANAHRAFVTCCLLAIRIDDHSHQDREDSPAGAYNAFGVLHSSGQSRDCTSVCLVAESAQKGMLARSHLPTLT